jgi:hypothetical protein
MDIPGTVQGILYIGRGPRFSAVVLFDSNPTLKRTDTFFRQEKINVVYVCDNLYMYSNNTSHAMLHLISDAAALLEN